MAGSGIRVFASGEILTAAQVNGYLMDQVVTRFADAATRDASFGGVGQPVLTEGRLCYLDDVNLVQFYDGASWQDSAQFTVGDGTISNAKLADNSVTSAKIAPGTVIAADVAAGTITATELADGAVTSGKILDGTIVNADISASAEIAKTKISGTAITAADSGTVTSTMIADGTITKAKIADRAVGSAELDGISINAGTTSAYTLVVGDANRVVTFSATTAVTIPASVFSIGDQINILQTGTGQVTITGPSVTVRLESSRNKTRGQYAMATVICIASNEFVVLGNVVA